MDSHLPQTCVGDCATIPDYTTSTGAVATLINAGVILSRYLQSFGENPSRFKQTDTYITSELPSDPSLRVRLSDQNTGNSVFHATTTFPSAVPIVSASSTAFGPAPFSSKLMAKRSAHLAAVQELHKKGELDDALEPTPGGEAPKPKKTKVKVPNGKTAADLSRWAMEGDKVLKEDAEDIQRGLNSRERWEIWKEAMQEKLAPKTPATASTPCGVGEYVTHQWASAFAHMEKEVHGTTLEWEGCRTLLLLTSGQLPDVNIALGDSQEMVVRGLGQVSLHKEQIEPARAYTERAMRAQLNKEFNIPDPLFYILPLKPETTPRPGKVRKYIDFDEVTRCLGDLTTPFSLDMLEEEVVNSLSSTAAETGQRCELVLRKDLSPGSLYPDKEKTIAEVVGGTYASQPILEATPVRSGRSGGILSPAGKPSYLIPQVARRYAFPADTYRSLTLLPTFLIRLCDWILAAELNHLLFDGAVDESLFQQALTAPLAAPNQPDRNYERLELLGDTIIKLIATLDMCQGDLSDERHVEKHVLLSNRSLRDSGTKAGIVPYIRASQQTTRHWMPLPQEKKAQIGDKIIADVVEAIVGAVYLSSKRSLEVSVGALRRLQIPIRMTRWPSHSVPDRRASGPLRTHASGADASNVLGYDFDKFLNARTPFDFSQPNRDTQAYMKFKAIGDALLDYFVVERLWEKYPEASPAAMTHMKHSRCGDATLCALAVHTRLYQHIDPDSMPRFDPYIAESTAARIAADEVGKEGLEYWSDTTKNLWLGDIPETVLGAVLVDSGYDIEPARELFTKHYLPFFDRYCIGPMDHSNHPKSLMMLHMGSLGCAGWKIQRVEGNHGPETIVIVHDRTVGIGRSPLLTPAVRAAVNEAKTKVTKDYLQDICDCPGRKR